MRQDYCVKDGISVTYNDENVAFEDVNTAEARFYSPTIAARYPARR